MDLMTILTALGTVAAVVCAYLAIRTYQKTKRDKAAANDGRGGDGGSGAIHDGDGIIVGGKAGGGGVPGSGRGGDGGGGVIRGGSGIIIGGEGGQAGQADGSGGRGGRSGGPNPFDGI